MNFDVVDERSNDSNSLWAGRLIDQDPLQLGYLSAVEVGQIGVNCDLSRFGGVQLGGELTLTSFQFCQLFAHAAWVPLSPEDEGETAFNAPLHLLTLLMECTDRDATCLVKSLQFFFELSRKFGNE